MKVIYEVTNSEKMMLEEVAKKLCIPAEFTIVDDHIFKTSLTSIQSTDDADGKWVMSIEVAPEVILTVCNVLLKHSVRIVHIVNMTVSTIGLLTGVVGDLKSDMQKHLMITEAKLQARKAAADFVNTVKKAAGAK